MEPRELYEPEDIEQLLIERPYDELLEDERAFVLRHLSGRAEYEAMRALLLRVHDDDGPAEAMDADPSVRVHVIDLFRAQQQPQWRIWLNSVPAFLFPGDVSAMWRPALALASIGLVVMVAVIGLRRLDEAAAPQLAHVQEKTAPVPVAEPQPPAADATTDVEPPSSVSGALSVQKNEGDERGDAPVFVHDMQAATAEEQQLEAPAPPALAEVSMDMRSDDAAAGAAEMETTEDLYKSIVSVPVPDSTITIAGTATHQVTANEMVYNYTSAASAPQTVDVISTKSFQLFAERQKSKKSKTARLAEFDVSKDTEAAADVSAFVALLRAAW